MATIGIDVRPLSGPYTGDRTYWKNLVWSLSRASTNHQFILYTRLPVPDKDIPLTSNVRLRVIPSKSDRLWSFIVLPLAARKDRVDLLHVQYTIPPRILCPFAVVTTVHDVSFRLYPEWFPKRHRILMNLTVPASMRAADHVITDSEGSLIDIQKCYHLPSSHISAIPLGLSDGFTAEPNDPEIARREAQEIIACKYGLKKPFILCLGVLQPRKNLNMLAEAYGKLRTQYGLGCDLVFVGKAGWLQGREEILVSAAEFGGSEARSGVVFPGYVPDEELPLWYRACDVYAHPSLYEGFGIPPLEALACSAPVIVSDAPALPELVGDAALVVPARDSSLWANALKSVLTDLAVSEPLRAGGPFHASLFSWTTTAERTLNVYGTVLRQRTRSL